MRIAAHHGHVESLKELIAAGADINKQDNEGQTALMTAAEEGQVGCLKELIATGDEGNTGKYVPLIKSIESGNALCVEEMLKAGANVNATDEDGNTPLLSAVDAGNETIVQILLEKGAAVNGENLNGKTALYQAVLQGHKKNHKSPLGGSGKQGKSYISAFSGIVYLLLQAGAQFNTGCPDFNPTTAHLNLEKIMKPNTHILKMLLAAGAELEHELFVSDEGLQYFARKTIRD